MTRMLENPARTLALAEIDIRNLRLRTYVGFNPEEKEKQQDVVINIRIDHALSDGVLSDTVGSELNYKTITKAVIAHVEQGRFLLLEKLAADVLAVCTEHREVRHARVTVDKPHALRFADSVAVTLHYDAESASGGRS